jgi:hypothetical protein
MDGTSNQLLSTLSIPSNQLGHQRRREWRDLE